MKREQNIESIPAEEEIIEWCKKDLSNFKFLYDTNYISIFRYIYQRVETESEAADICSQVFLKAMQKIGEYEYRGIPFSAWLYTIARNEMNLMFRDNKYSRVINISDQSFDSLASELQSYDFNKEQLLVELDNVLNELSKDDLELIEMRYFEKRSYAEIEQILGKPANNLKMKVSRIIKRMRTRIEVAK